MRISFSPQRRDGTLAIEKTSDDRLSINGDIFNFGTMNDGDIVPAGAVPCDWITGPVEKVNGEVRLTIVLPHGPKPPAYVAFPQPITVTADGPIAIPQAPEAEDVDA